MRSAFLLDPSVVFLNHGSFGACPREVLEVRRRFEEEMETEPVEFLGRRSSALLEAAGAALGAFVGSEPEDLAFVSNATMGVAVAAASVGLRPGEEVLASDMEYGACELVWERACARAGAVYRRFSVPLPWEGEEAFMGRLEAALGPRTRVLFLSHVTSATACRLPVERVAALCRERGLVLVVDGAHAPAQLPLGLAALGAAFYVGNCHKWLCAPKGSAFLRVERSLHGAVEPPWASWGLVDEAAGSSFHEAYAGASPLARRLRWLGTRDLSPFLATPAAIEFVQRVTTGAERARLEGLAAGAARRAAELLGLPPLEHGGAGLRMSLVPLPAGVDAAALKSALFDRHRVEVPATSHGGRSFLRLSFQHYNDEADAEKLLEALEAELGRGGGRRPARRG